MLEILQPFPLTNPCFPTVVFDLKSTCSWLETSYHFQRVNVIVSMKDAT